MKTHLSFWRRLARAVRESVSLATMTAHRDHRPLLLILASALLGLQAIPGYAQEPEPRIELYTVGRGDYLFSKFGHAALCVVRPTGREGLCYNYGTADFSTPGPLAWAVLRGRAEFWVSVAPTDQMLAFYRAEDRTIYRQVLPLEPEQAAQMERALSTSALPENRQYRYDHFLDNCSTRPRDHIDAATGGALRSVPDDSLDRSFTFRTLIRENLANDPVYFLLAESFLGRPMDRERSEYEAMFLPRILRDAVERHLRVAPEVVYARRGPIGSRPPLVVMHRLVLAFAIGIAACLTVTVGSPRTASRSIRLFAYLFGTLGCAAWILAVLSPIPEIRYNEILLVFLPTDFLLLLGSTRAASVYLRVRVFGLLLVALLLASGILIQPLGTFLSLTLPVLSAAWVRELARSPSAR